MPTATPTSDLTSFLSELPGGPDVNRLYDNVQAEVPAVGLALIQMAAWNTIEEFFIRSTTRREKVFWQMPPGVYAVDFNPFSADWLVAWILDYSDLLYGKIEPPGLLRDVQPAPQSQQLRQGKALLALKPASFASDFGPYIWQQWFETILAGTLWRLYRQPAKPWSSPQLATMNGQMYRAGINRARAIADRDLTDSGGRWRFPYFSHGRRKN